ncbi:tetratricopeptide repeat protein [Halomonas halmophila]|uniref:Tetratricopeptide repeat protein n=1 Tax=Halomonas halmophila TaxID=252 RepID=A0A4Y4F7L0_9GAMM|nr:hypothetical protein [Halomonas halmophila]GED23814.1 hypothetical protein HHA01_27910 [Halomonas halmophila]
MLNNVQKRCRDRANRARRALLKEKETYGQISDGSGKRYLVGVDYLLSGAPEKAVEFMEWFEQEFPDDVGEPVFWLYAALTYYRMGSLAKARRYLLEAMLSNIYLLPFVYSRPLPRQDMWHSSGWQDPEYVTDMAEFLDEPTPREQAWIREQFEGERFTEIRNTYIATFHALRHAESHDTHLRLLHEWGDYIAAQRHSSI